MINVNKHNIIDMNITTNAAAVSQSCNSSSSTADLEASDSGLTDVDLTSNITVKRGRLQAPIWKLFTDDTDAHLKKSVVCKHCKETVTYHRKSELVQAHLCKCRVFNKLMMSTDIAERPQWFADKKVKRCSVPNARAVTVSAKQTAMTQYALPPMSTKLKNQFQETIALHYYMTGTAFQRIEEKNLTTAIHLLRPDAVLPDRHKLGGVLLDQCYSKMKIQCDNYMKSPSSCVCLISDGWSNVKNEPIVNYMATSPSKTMFLESVATGTQGHSAEWIASDLDRVMQKYPDTSFAGAVTDNTSANKAAWEIMKINHPSMFFHGCVSHGLHLMVKDIFAATKTKKSGQSEPTYPDGYPFETMLQLATDCKDVVKFVNNHHAIKTKVTKMQMVEKLHALALPAPTRWGTLQQCLRTILDSEHIIHGIVNERDFISGTKKQKEDRLRIKNIVIAGNFVGTLKKALKILVEIDKLIVKFQSDNVPVSEVFSSFNELPRVFAQMNTDLSAAEIKYLGELAASRFQFMYGDAHGIAYLLDPRFVGDGLSADDRRDLEDLLVAKPEDDASVALNDERKMLLLDQLTQYVIAALREKNASSIRYKMLQTKRKTPLQFWQSDGAVWPDLQKIALKVFTMATSSATSERNFSTFGFVHSKLRNSLSIASVEKLVFIKTNYSALTDDTSLEFEAPDDEKTEQSSDAENDSDTESDSQKIE